MISLRTVVYGLDTPYFVVSLVRRHDVWDTLKLRGALSFWRTRARRLDLMYTDPRMYMYR